MDSPFVASRFPSRRRAVQACVACSHRKTRCDAAQPRCGYCASHNIECVYRDAQQPRIDYNTQVLLERMQILEDRLLRDRAETRSTQLWQRQCEVGSIDSLDVQIATPHTANTDHVFSWPIVQNLLSLDVANGDPGARVPRNATDCFFKLQSNQHDHPCRSWRLDDDLCLSHVEFTALVDVYFSEINVFFPLLSRCDIEANLQVIRQPEPGNHGGHGNTVPSTTYALVLLILCFARFVQRKGNMVGLNGLDHTARTDAQEQILWSKAQLLLGSVSLETSITAAQCSMVTSLYRGACGKIAEAYSWSHAAAVKCEVLARHFTSGNAEELSEVPEDFKRLYWIAFITEGDFTSEISINLPSGICRYEELIPYPSLTDSHDNHQDTAVIQREQLVAFQVTTNASIRRFLNRVNSAIYNGKEQERQQRDAGSDHAAWLLRVSRDLWQHHADVYRNLPAFMLRPDQGVMDTPPGELTTIRTESLLPYGNNPWNITRLKGRYHAGQYIIHRPFIEYALLYSYDIDTHPQRLSILEKCTICLNGCIGFNEVFDVDTANSITCLFATGMVTFAMTIIMMVATACPLLKEILPVGLEEAIISGRRNLKRFSHSVREFASHVDILERLDQARRRSFDP